MVEILFENGVLRELKESDVKKLDDLASEKEILDFYFLNEKERKTMFQKALRNFDIPKSKIDLRRRYNLAVEEQGEVKGYLSLRLWIQCYHEEKNMTDISYFIGKQYRRQGIAERALTAVLPFIFDELNTERLSALCLSENTASRNLLEKLGLTVGWQGADPRKNIEMVRYQITSKEFEEKRELVYTG